MIGVKPAGTQAVLSLEFYSVKRMYSTSLPPITPQTPFSLNQLHPSCRTPLARRLLPRQPRLILVRGHTLDSPRRRGIPLNPRIDLAHSSHPIRHIPLCLLDPRSRLVAILQIDNRHHRDLPVPQMPHVRAPSPRLALRTLVLARTAESDFRFDERSRGEDRAAVPAGEDLEWRPRPDAFERGGVVPKDVPGRVPVPVGGYVEEGVAVHAARDPDVVEGRVGTDVRPIHTADHIGILVVALVDQF